MNEIIRSKKINDIILSPPKKILLIGPILAIILVLGMLFFSYYLPYPESVRVKILIKCDDNSIKDFYAIAVFDQNVINKVKSAQKTTINLDRFPKNDFGIIKAIVDTTSAKLLNGKYMVRLKISKDYNYQIKLEDGLTGNCKVTISNRTLFKRILGTTFRFNHSLN